MAKRNRQRKAGGQPRVLNAPAARAQAPNRPTRLPPVPFTGTERLLSLAPTPADGGSFIRSFAWNPGLAETFSVGHFQAQNFDKFEMGALNSISYTPACSTLTSGSVYILIDYDPNDPAPPTQEDFADNELTKTCALYSKMSALIEPQQLDKCKMLIRTGPSQTDKLLTDPCAIHIGAFGYGTEAETNGLTLGHFHINYSAKLFVRQPMATTVQFPRNMVVYGGEGGFIGDPVTTILQTTTPINTLGAVYSGGSITLPAGYYSVHSRCGLIVPPTSGASSTTFVSLEVRVNGVRVDRSQSVINRVFSVSEAVSLTSTTPILVSEGDTVTQVIFQDSDTPITLLSDRTLLSFQLL